MKTFHHPTLDSPRLAKLLAYLRERGNLGATTFELTAECLTTRAASDVSELRVEPSSRSSRNRFRDDPAPESV